jgi:DNA-binding transcriptional LysR family regulator
MRRLSAVETFIRAIDAGSFSDAAKQLRVGPPRLSRFAV